MDPFSVESGIYYNRMADVKQAAEERDKVWFI